MKDLDEFLDAKSVNILTKENIKNGVELHLPWLVNSLERDMCIAISLNECKFNLLFRNNHDKKGNRIPRNILQECYFEISRVLKEKGYCVNVYIDEEDYCLDIKWDLA